MASPSVALPKWLERVLQVNATAYVTVPGLDKTYRTRIEDVAGRTIAVAIPSDGGNLVRVPRGASIGLFLIGPVRLYRMEARVVRILRRPVPMWVVELPPVEEIEAVQRRRAVRVAVLLNAEVRLQAPEDEGSAVQGPAPVFRGQVVDISATGARLIVWGHMELGDEVELTVQFPWGPESLKGRIVFRAPASETPAGARLSLNDPRWSYGVEFRDVSPKLESRVHRFVLERQGELRARGLL